MFGLEIRTRRVMVYAITAVCTAAIFCSACTAPVQLSLKDSSAGISSDPSSVAALPQEEAAEAQPPSQEAVQGTPVKDGEQLMTNGGKRYIGEVDPGTVKLNDVEMLTNVFVTPLIRSSNVWAKSWDKPSELEADYFIQFCGINNLLKRPLIETGDGLESTQPVCAAQEVEQAIQRYFDVKSEYLRTSSTYDAAADTYTLPSLCGGGQEVFATGAEKDGARLNITVAMSMLGEKDKPFLKGVLTVELKDESFRYLSYKVVWKNTEKTQG